MMKSMFVLLVITVRAACVNPHALDKTATLRGGITMPSVELGSSGGCGPDSFGTPDGKPCTLYNATMSWYDLGGRASHDALSYGNQYGVGRAAADFIKANPDVKRSDLFLMSMVPKFLMGYDATKASVAASLDQMGLQYLDLVMLHHRAADIGDWPRSSAAMKAFNTSNTPWMTNDAKGRASWGVPPCAQYANDPTGNWLACQDGSWKALTELKKAGKIKAIGVSNWQLSNLQRMKDLGQELPAVNQIEVHVGYHEDDLIDWCIANQVQVQAATPLARSLPALVKPGSNELITSIATKYKKSPAQVALRFLLEKGVAIIPSTTDPSYQVWF
jgi:diketogulonate reductase-like aldo/keto reductase